MKLKKLIESSNLDIDNIHLQPNSGEDLNIKSSFDSSNELNPEDFLDFAENDLNNENINGYVNALSNAKRAIDCRIDQLLIIFGINQKKMYFPQKLEYLKDIGLIAPKIIEKVNRNRNYLEHNYKCPNEEKASDAVDIASLFIEAINNKLSTVWMDFFLIDDLNDSKIRITFDLSQFLFKIYVFDTNNDDIIIKINRSNKNEYKNLLKLMISLNVNKNNKRLIKEVFS